MPHVDLLYYTGMETGDPYYAARLLAFTKNTRLNMTPSGFSEFLQKDEAWLDQEMDYMSKTIRSALEFVDVTFLIQKVSRATAQQITRTRNASYQMQSQRVTDMRNASWDTGPYDGLMKAALLDYEHIVDNGVSLEEAREMLPIGLHCNLVAKYNLRSAIDVIRGRESARVQGPYRDVAAQMKGHILNAWPWSAPFFRDPNQIALDMLNSVVEELKGSGAVYQGAAGTIAKAIDLLKEKG